MKQSKLIAIIAALACLGCCAVPLFALLTSASGLAGLAMLASWVNTDVVMCILSLFASVIFSAVIYYLFKRYQNRKKFCAYPSDHCNSSACGCDKTIRP